MSRALVAACLSFSLLLTATARAEPEPRARLYGEFGVGVGWLDGRRFTQGFGASVDGGFLHLRWSLGGAFPQSPGSTLYLGPVLDLLRGPRNDSEALGLEGELSIRVQPGWHLGPRVSVSGGSGGSSPTQLRGTTTMAGVRFRAHAITLSMDAIYIVKNARTSHGLLANVSVGGRPGKYAVLVSGAGAAVFFVVALVLLSRVDDTDNY